MVEMVEARTRGDMAVLLSPAQQQQRLDAIRADVSVNYNALKTLTNMYVGKSPEEQKQFIKDVAAIWTTLPIGWQGDLIYASQKTPFGKIPLTSEEQTNKENSTVILQGVFQNLQERRPGQKRASYEENLRAAFSLGKDLGTSERIQDMVINAPQNYFPETVMYIYNDVKTGPQHIESLYKNLAKNWTATTKQQWNVSTETGAKDVVAAVQGRVSEVFTEGPKEEGRLAFGKRIVGSIMSGIASDANAAENKTMVPETTLRVPQSFRKLVFAEFDNAGIVINDNKLRVSDPTMNDQVAKIFRKVGLESLAKNLESSRNGSVEIIV